MEHIYGASDFGGWGWILTLGLTLLIISNAASWAYIFAAHRKIDGIKASVPR